jgi:ADP-ribosylglycohydrolase
VREEFYQTLRRGPLFSEASQTLAVALGMLVAAQGDLQRTIIGCVNYGRDNDSYASVAGAVVGALHGARAVPADWIATVTSANPRPDLRALAVGLCEVTARRQHRRLETAESLERLMRPCRRT